MAVVLALASGGSYVVLWLTETLDRVHPVVAAGVVGLANVVVFTACLSWFLPSLEELKRLATRDPLTGCLNRNAFWDTLAERWKAAVRYDLPLSCIMLDIDHFKTVNDSGGHAAGDQVLLEVANVVTATVRETDYVCRYGGDEFCVLLPYVDSHGASQAAERIRAAIAEIPESSITVSLGVSDRSSAETPDDLIVQADRCLYEAKQKGRDQAVVN